MIRTLRGGATWQRRIRIRKWTRLLDRLLDGKRPEEIVGSGGLLEGLTKRLLERALEGELTD